MSDTPTVVTDEMKQRLPGVWRGLYVALVENAATIDKLRADVERLRGACLAVSEDPWPVQPNVGEPDRCGWCQRYVDDSSDCHDEDCPVRQIATALSETEPGPGQEQPDRCDEDQKALDAERNALEDHYLGIGRNPLG